MTDYLTALQYHYAHYRWPELDKPALHYADIEPVLARLNQCDAVQMTLVGHSHQGRPIHCLSIGHGPRCLFGWTQMHGNEPTTTAAVLDWLHLLASPPDEVAPAGWQTQCKIVMLVMLNPDGAAAHTRENAQGIDINRDARAVQSPEAAILWQQLKRHRPQLAFNLHDQSRYYRAGAYSKAPSTLAFYAPPAKDADTATAHEHHAQQLIAALAETLRNHFDAALARYVDSYSARCFGDQCAALCPTILIECGAAYNDPARCTARQMAVTALHRALLALLPGAPALPPVSGYTALPPNIENGLYDVLLRHVAVEDDGARWFADIGINTQADWPQIMALGDLQEQGGFIDLDGQGEQLLVRRGHQVQQPETLTTASYLAYLRQGISYFIDSENLLTIETDWPVLQLSTPLANTLLPATPAVFVMARAQQPSRAVLGTTVVDLVQGQLSAPDSPVPRR